MSHGGDVSSRLLELGVGALDGGDRPIGPIGDAQLRVAEAEPLRGRRRHAVHEKVLEGIAQGPRRGAVEVVEPLHRLFRRSC